MSTMVIDRMAVILAEGGMGAGSARAAAANTVRSWASGKDYRGREFRREVRNAAADAIAEHDRRMRGQLSEAERAIARVEAAGSPLPAEQQRVLAGELGHRASVAEGLLLAVDTPRGQELAAAFLGEGFAGADRNRLSNGLRAIVDVDGMLAEAMGYARATGQGRKPGTFHGMHGVQKAVRHRTHAKGQGAVTCVHCSAVNPPGAIRCANCQKPPTLPETAFVPPNANGQALVEAPVDVNGSIVSKAPASGGAKPKARKGAKAKPVPTKGALPGSTDFEKLHPRGRAGGSQGGRFIKKGEGNDTANGSSRVLMMQQRLNELGANLADDGKFGPATEKALKEFQTRYGLDPSGVLDYRTAETMRQPPPDTAAKARGEIAAITNPPKKGTGSRSGGSGGSGGSGSSGRGASSSSGPVSLNPNDRNGIRKFQQQHGLAVTGTIDPETRGALKAVNAKSGAKSGSGRGSSGGSRGVSSAGGGSGSRSRGSSGSASSSSGGLVRRGDGMTGQPDPNVSKLQGMLDDLGYDLGDGGVDGRFGEATQKALQRMQQRAGLRVDGIAGPQTMAMLKRMAKRLQNENQFEYGTSPVGSTAGASGKPATSSRRLRKVQEAVFGIDGIHIVPGEEPDPADETNVTSIPPNLRESGAQEWEMCGNCVHFNTKQRCLLFAYPVDRNDLCDSHFSVTPEQQRSYAGLIRKVTELEVAEAAGDSRAIARARAGRDLMVRRLEESGAAQLVEAADSMRKASQHEPVGKPGGPGLWHKKGLQLPAYIQHIANDLKEKRGMDTGRAIATAINAVKRWARGGGKVDAGTKAAAAKALAEWEALKLRHSAPEDELISALVKLEEGRSR